MRIKHHILFDDKSLMPTFEEMGFYFKSEFVVFEIYEDDSRWPLIVDFMQRYQVGGNRCSVEFSHEELARYHWLTLWCTWQNGYPLPDSGPLDSIAGTYDLSQYCTTCGAGWRQVAPFRILSEPTWKRRKIMMLNWILDAFFVSPQTWHDVFRPFDIGYRPVYKRMTGVPMETVVQLDIPAVLPGTFDLSGDSAHNCAVCGTTTYFDPRSGRYPAMSIIPTTGHAYVSQEEFRGGTLTFRQVFFSHEVYMALHAYGDKNCEFTPVVNTEFTSP